MKVEDKLKEIGLSIPETPKPMAAYVPAKRVGNLVFTSGQGPIVAGVPKYRGKVGRDLSIEEGKKAAELTMLNCLSAVKSVVGDLEKVVEVVKVLGFVNSAPGFNQQPQVMNGASELLEKIFGERGKHARSAIGTSDLPLDIPVEIEMIVQVKD